MTGGGFSDCLEDAIGRENAAVCMEALESEASVSVRLNPFKAVEGLFAGGKAVPWSRHGIMLSSRPVFTLDPLFHGGAYYVQDSSSMFVGEMFRRTVEKMFAGVAMHGRPLRVLDLCAAPGGKSTDLAASLRELCGDNFVLVVNEVMKQRAVSLADNMAMWGEANVIVTSADPVAFARLGGYFDIVLADVPCSGEGMFRKDAEARRQWSLENVSLCSARQKRIIADVWPSVAPGGVMIYSTCTFNRHENDLNVQWIMENLGAESVGEEWFEDECRDAGVLKTEYGYSLVPGLVSGEGQYCSAVVKDDVGKPFGGVRGGMVKGVKENSLGMLFARPVELRQKDSLLIAMPAEVSAEMELIASKVRPMRVGCAVGEIRGRDLVPSADLALSMLLADDGFAAAELSREDALRFLHRDTISLPDSPRGYVVVRFNGVALGFVKNLGTRCNNLHPQGRRIRMDIPV